jgi:hypothetical protein
MLDLHPYCPCSSLLLFVMQIFVNGIGLRSWSTDPQAPSSRVTHLFPGLASSSRGLSSCSAACYVDVFINQQHLHSATFAFDVDTSLLAPLDAVLGVDFLIRFPVPLYAPPMPGMPIGNVILLHSVPAAHRTLHRSCHGKFRSGAFYARCR